VTGPTTRRDRYSRASTTVTPAGIVLDAVLAETLAGLRTHAGHDVSADNLDRIEEKPRFHVASVNADAFATGKARFRRRASLSFVVRLSRRVHAHSGPDVPLCVDENFDSIGDVERLSVPTNPFKRE
jgi:hypothetical protein